MHKSYLEFGCHVEDLLFKGITVQSPGGMVGLCLSVALFTFTYEGVKTFRQRYSLRHHRPRPGKLHMKDDTDFRTESTLLMEMDYWQSSTWKRFKSHLVHALLYMIQVTMGYLLMLVIMSYNGWLAITVFVSAGISYYIFSSFVLYRPSVIPIEILSPEDSGR